MNNRNIFDEIAEKKVKYSRQDKNTAGAIKVIGYAVKTILVTAVAILCIIGLVTLISPELRVMLLAQIY